MYKKALPTLLKKNTTLSFILRSIYSVSRVKCFNKPLMYTLNDKLQKQKVMALIDEFSENLKNISGKCMDIGCGPGDITNDIILPVLNTNAIVIGTDILKHMIEYANSRYSIKKRLEFEVLDVQTKNLPKKYVSEFDCILSFHTLHWCTDIRQAFKNIHCMLRPDGRMLVQFVASHDIFKVLENIAQDIRFAPYMKDVNKYIWPLHNSVNPRNKLKELLQEIGFTVIHCSHREMYHIDENQKQLFSSILSFLEFIDQMPCNRKEEFVKEFALKFAETQIIFEKKK